MWADGIACSAALMTNPPPRDPSEVWRLSGDPAREALDMLMRAANLLMVAHAAAIFGGLTLLKDRSEFSEMTGFGLFPAGACLGFMAALFGYGVIFMERVNWLRSEPLTLAERPDFKRSFYALMASFIVLFVYVGALAIVSMELWAPSTVGPPGRYSLVHCVTAHRRIGIFPAAVC